MEPSFDEKAVENLRAAFVKVKLPLYYKSKVIRQNNIYHTVHSGFLLV